MSNIAATIKDLHLKVLTGPATAYLYASEKYGEHSHDGYVSRAIYLETILDGLEPTLRYLLEDLTGEKLPRPEGGYRSVETSVKCGTCGTCFPLVRDAGNCPKCGSLVERDDVAAAETAPHETVSIGGEEA